MLRHFCSPVLFYRATTAVEDSFTGGGMRKHLNYVAYNHLHIPWAKMSSLYWGETSLFFKRGSSSDLRARVNSKASDLRGNPKGNQEPMGDRDGGKSHVAVAIESPSRYAITPVLLCGFLNNSQKESQRRLQMEFLT